MLMTALLAGGSVVDLDATVFIQLVAFLLLFVLLRSILFKPLLNVLSEREKCTEGDVKEAKKRQAEAEEKIKKYERELQRIREKASVEREKIRESGRVKEAEILERAREEVNKVVEEGRETIEEQAQKVRTAMDQEINVISKEIVSAVLGRKAA